MLQNIYDSHEEQIDTVVIDGTQVKIYAWYDNEWGYMNRMMEFTDKVVASLE